MLIVKTNKGKSDIQGEGIFAAEEIKKGQPVWAFREGYDLKIEQAIILDAELKEYLDKFATVSLKKEKVLFESGYQNISYEDRLVYEYDGDDCKYMNHSDTPNIGFTDTLGMALKDIELNEELTCDYRTITTKEHFDYLMLGSYEIINEEIKTPE